MMKKLKILFLFFMLAIFAQATYAQCGNIPGFTKLGEHNGHGYYLSNNTKPWTQAKTLAANAGGYLATMNDQAENSFVQAHLGGNMVFIGFNDANSEGNPQWANGEPVTLDLSYNNNAQHDFAVMNFWAGTWQMEQAGPWRKFVMEMDCGNNSDPANLIISGTSCPTGYPIDGSQFTVTVEITNTGGQTSEPKPLYFHQKNTQQNGGPASNYFLSQYDVPAIPAGENIVLTKTFTLTNSYFPGSWSNSGSSYPGIYGDFEFSFGKTPQFFSWPDSHSLEYYCKKYSTDLSVSASSNNLTYTDDGTINYQVVVSNNGPVTAYNLGAIYVTNKFQDGTTINSSGLTVSPQISSKYTYQGALWHIASLSPGQSKTIDVSYTLPIGYAANSDEFELITSIWAGHNTNAQLTNDTSSLVFVHTDNNTSCGNVPGFTKLGEYNGHGYYLSNDTKPWTQAKTLAANAGGYLATMNDQAENSFVQAHLSGNMVFIGFNDANSEGNPQWANGEPVTLDLSYNNNAQHDFAVMNFWAGTWQMEQAGPWRKYVMEMNCGTTTGEPDLQITNVDCPSAFPIPDGNFTVTVDVTNNGTGNSPADQVLHFYQRGSDLGGGPASSFFSDTFDVPVVAPGQTLTLTKTFQFTNGFIPGWFSDYACDYADALGDFGFEFNPIAYLGLQPDFTLDFYCKKFNGDLSINATSSDLTYDDNNRDLHYTVVVTNDGPETAYNIRANVIHDYFPNGATMCNPPTTTTPNVTLKTFYGGASWHINSLAPGASRTINLTYNLPTFYTADQFEIATSVSSGHNININTSNDESSLIFVHTTNSTSCGTIPGFTKLGEHNGHGYYLSNDTKPWTQAKTLAANAGGYLATMNDQAENSFVQAHLSGNMVFIGFNDANSEGNPQWANGEPVTLDLSYNNNAQHDFAVMNFWAGTWQMEQAGPWRKYVMEMSCSIVTPAPLENNVVSESIISLYPNPANDLITLEVNSLEEQRTTFHIYDGRGQLLLSENRFLSQGTSVLKIDVANLPIGMYFVKEANSTSYQKFVILR